MLFFDIFFIYLSLSRLNTKKKIDEFNVIVCVLIMINVRQTKMKINKIFLFVIDCIM